MWKLYLKKRHTSQRLCQSVGRSVDVELRLVGMREMDGWIGSMIFFFFCINRTSSYLSSVYACRPSRENLSRAGGGVKHYVIRVIDRRIGSNIYIYIYRRAHLREEGKERTMVFFTQSAVEPTGERKKIVIGDLPKRPPWLETYQLTAAWTCRPLLFTPKPSPTITVSHACKRECMRPPIRGIKVL